MLNGKYKFELHCHTSETSPCSGITAKELVELYKKAGYDGMVITDHLIADIQGKKGSVEWNDAVNRFLKGWRAAKAEGEKLGLPVFLGAEIRFPKSLNDYLVMGLTEKLLEENEWLYELDLPQFYRFADKNGLLVIQAHPFREMCSRADPKYLHGAEVYNGHAGHNSHNDLALAFAEENGLIPTAGSDCHYIGAVGTACVCFDKMPETTKDIVECLKSGAYSINDK